MESTVRKVGLWLSALCFYVFGGCLGSVDATYANDQQDSIDSSVPDKDNENRGGGEEIVLNLPLPSGVSTLCTQGVDGSFSHSGVSTRYDLDFDTSNFINEEIYAPISGIVQVHYVAETGSPFGNHVCIDTGNGMYVVVAHAKRFFVRDGQEVSAGQLIGLEGCTGFCTGDHVHIGLHQGDATLPAERGISIPANYTVMSEQLGNTSFLAGDEFVCGVGRESDPTGEVYVSALQVAMSHPDGTIVITPHNVKVYLLSGGKRHWFANEQVFWSMGYDFSNLTMISDDELNCYEEGESFSSFGFVEAVKDPSGTLWLIIGTRDDQTRYRIEVKEFGWKCVLASWGLEYTKENQPKSVDWTHPYITDWVVVDGTAKFRNGSLIKEISKSDVYVAGHDIALPIMNWATFLALGFRDRPIIQVEDGVVISVQKQVGNCTTDVRCLDINTISVCGNGSLAFSDGFGYDVPTQTSSYGPEGSEVGGFGEPTEDNSQGGQEEINEPKDVGMQEAGPDTHTDSDAGSNTEADTTPTQTPDATQDGQGTEEQAGDGGIGDVGMGGDIEIDPAVQNMTICQPGVAVCLDDLDLDGIPETLLMADNLWLSRALYGAPAYVYATDGGCFDGMLSEPDRVESLGGYYAIDFSMFALDCSSRLTLVSSIGRDSALPAQDMSNWMWWQGANFCSQGNELCELMNNGRPWEEWLISIVWDPMLGLTANGNGLTDNSQLH